jgi:hypothetical protein
MIHHWIDDSLENPLASTLPPNMKEMKGFHLLEVAILEKLVARGLNF